MEVQLLREQDIFPTKEVLKHTLGRVYEVLEALETEVTDGKFALTLDWNYYRDGKSWLCKVCNKKKTVFWLSVWEGCFKTSFFFLGRHLEDIAALGIDDTCYHIEKEWGKMIPVIFTVNDKKQIPDLMKMIEFKR